MRLFGLTIADTTVAAASLSLIEAARSNQKQRVVFANAHVINEITARAEYRAVVETADRIYADGSGLALIRGVETSDVVLINRSSLK